MYINKVFIIGNLTKDVELKALPSGTYVANIGVDTNRSWKDQNGVKQEEVEYHNIVAFGKQAEVLKQYCFKGDQIYLDGRLQTRSWEVDGKKNYKTEIIMESFQFGNKKKGSEVVKDNETGEEVPDVNTIRTLTEEQKENMTVQEVAENSDIPF